MTASPELTYVHVFVPSDDPARTRTLVLLHGTGGDEHDLLPLGSRLLPGASLLSLRGNVDENGMARFFRRLAPGVLDVDDLKARTHNLDAFVRAASDHYGFDRSGTTVVGYSNGANIAASLLFLHPDTVRSALLLHPMLPFVPDASPDLSGIRVFIGAGERDPMVPVESTTELIKLMEDAGADVTAYWHPGGHEITEEELANAKEWLNAER